MFLDSPASFKITVLRCDPIDQRAALPRLGIPDVTWSLSGGMDGDSPVDRLLEPITQASNQGGWHVWKNYLTAMSSMDTITQQMICDRFHELYFQEFDSPCQITILQTDLAPIPESIAFFVDEQFVELPTTSEIQEILAKFNLPSDNYLLRLSTGLSHADLEGCLRNLDRTQEPHGQVDKFRSKRLELKGLRYDPPSKNTEIGGLDLLVDWVQDLEYRLSPAAEAMDLPYPKGILLAGVPGTGKTFAAKAISAQLGYPMFSLSMDAVQSGGAQVLQQLLKLVESCAPCILFADEIEKLFSGEVDGRVLATFLSWLNDKTAKVFVIGTLNRIANMPIEMTRSGRFDRIFFIDSPGEGQRVELCRLFLKRYDARFTNPDDPVFALNDWQYFADSTIEFIGAEIQQVVQDTIARICRQDKDAIVKIDDLITTALVFNSMYKRDPRKVLEIRNTLTNKADPASSGSRKFLPDRQIDIYAPLKLA
jgi:ATPase family associated with various cellular activities (AAA)